MANFDSAHECLRELERLRRCQEPIIRKINKIHSQLQNTSSDLAEKSSDSLWIKLRGLYNDAKQYADDEEKISMTLIGLLDDIIAPGQAIPHRKKSEGGEQKRKRMKAEADPSRLSSPSISLRSPAESPAIAIGDQVAARISHENADNDEWIVVKVIRFDRESNKFEVIDEEPGDEEESTAQRKYKLPYSCIIPFPKPTDPSSAPEFPMGSQVLAVYPGTTALYKAAVAAMRKRKTDEYVLEFDDDEEEGVDGLPKRQVPFHHVVQLPEGHRQ